MYYSDITGLDKEMGKVFDLAKERFGDNFIFIYTADHGAQWPFGKWNLYDAGIRVPMVMVWPNHIKPRVRTNAMVSWIDIFPTLLDITGSKIPSDLDGKSFAKVLENNNATFRDYIFTTHSGDGNKNIYPIRSVRSDRYKYIRNLHPEFYHSTHSDIDRRPAAGEYWNSWDSIAKTDPKAREIICRYYQRPAEEYYDLETDPTEQHNLINKPELANQIDIMRKMLDKWILEQGDELKIFNEPYYLYQERPSNKQK
jgi:arylsulfatase A-like enzyme